MASLPTAAELFLVWLSQHVKVPFAKEFCNAAEKALNSPTRITHQAETIHLDLVSSQTKLRFRQREK